MPDRLVLGSGSPRRRELLERAGFTFSVMVPDADETIEPGWTTEEVAVRLAGKKADALWPRIPGDTVLLTCDTIVACDHHILGKPSGDTEAINTLKMLSGRRHVVISGVHLRCRGHRVSFSEHTHVDFCPLTDAEIRFYVSNYEVADKAGAYAVQEWIGLIGVERMTGSYYNVMGLPVHRVYAELATLGIHPFRT